MSAALISLLHPTCRVTASEAFPRGWRNAFDAWLESCDHREQVEYIVAVHESRWDEFWNGPLNGRGFDLPFFPNGCQTGNATTFAAYGLHSFTVVKNTGRDCVVDQCNCAAVVSTGKLLMGVMDDYFPPEHWDSVVLEAMGDHADGESILVCSTGAERQRELELMIGGAETRSRFERYGYILDPDFESMFADNWRAFQARRDEAAGLVKIIERLDIVFDHRHPIFGKGQMDAGYELQNRPEAYFAGSVALQQKMTGARVIVMCLPGENFRSELTASRFQLIEDTKNRSRYGIVAPYWGHTTNVYATRIELTKSALEFPSITKQDDLILTADDDNPLDFPQLQMLIQDLEDRPELAGVLAWCWCDHNEGEDGESKTWVMSCGRQNLDDLACLRFTPEDFDRAIERGGCLISSDDIKPHVFWSGLPVLLIRRSALEEMGWRSFIARTADPILVEALKAVDEFLDMEGILPGYRNLETDVVRAKLTAALKWAAVLDATQNGMTSEDTSFFIRAHELGLKFAVDIRVRVPHVKWRGITPQYVPEREREQVQKVQGLNYGPLSLK